MSFRDVELGFYVRHDEKKAKEVIIAAYKKSRYNREATAERLGIGWRTFCRYIAQLELSEELTKIGERKG